MKILRTYASGSLVVEDRQLGRMTAECADHHADCFKTMKFYKCGCTTSWSNHFTLDDKRIKSSYDRKKCKTSKCNLHLLLKNK
jgi:hypothetical protein